MPKFALLTCLTLGAAALCAIAGVITATVADSGSALVVVVVMALGILVIGLLEWTHRRGSSLGHAVHGADPGFFADSRHVRDRDTLRALDELRAARLTNPAPRIPGRPQLPPPEPRTAPSATHCAPSEQRRGSPGRPAASSPG